MKKPSGLFVIIFGVCAVLWTVKVIFEITNPINIVPGFWFVLDVLCAVLWITAFVVNLKRYLSNKEEQ